MTWISPGISSGCHGDVRPLLEQGADTPPARLIETLSERVGALRATPLQFRGIEIPERAEVSILGTNVKIRLESLAALLQLSLAPVLIIWLGSLYNTRYRESLIIGKARDTTVVFPHLINVYPAVDIPTLRKHNRLAYWMPPAQVIFTMYSLTRVGLIAFVVWPAVGCYLVSLVLLPVDGIAWLSFLSGALVVLVSILVVGVELLPWHAAKIFPGVVRR